MEIEKADLSLKTDAPDAKKEIITNFYVGKKQPQNYLNGLKLPLISYWHW
jgi:hypothetical protein